MKRSLLVSLQQTLGNPFKTETCTANGLLDRIRSLKASSAMGASSAMRASPNLIIVWLAQSPLASSVRQIGESIEEIGERRVFIALEGSPHDASLMELSGELHPYVFPEPDGSSPTIHSIASETQFWRVINALAADISRLINGENAGSGGPSVFLAPVSDPLEPIARKLRHDLESRGFDVRPKTNSGLLSEIDVLLAGSNLSIHLFGQSGMSLADQRPLKGLYGVQQPMDVFRATLAFARSHPEFRVLGWTDAQSSDATTASMLSDQILRESKEFSLAAEVIQSTIEDFKSLLYDRLGASASPTMLSSSPTAIPRQQEILPAPDGAQLYVIYDPRDAEAAKPVTSFLQHQGISVLLPEFPAEQSMLRTIHNENLRRCDGVLIVYGAVQEQWVRMKQQDLLRAAALGRKKGLSAKGVFLCSNKTEGKLRFTAPDMMIINGFDSTAALAPFIQRLSAT